jgi:hypothetical protein
LELFLFFHQVDFSNASNEKTKKRLPKARPRFSREHAQQIIEESIRVIREISGLEMHDHPCAQLAVC